MRANFAGSGGKLPRPMGRWLVRSCRWLFLVGIAAGCGSPDTSSTGSGEGPGNTRSSSTGAGIAGSATGSAGLSSTASGTTASAATMGGSGSGTSGQPAGSSSAGSSSAGSANSSGGSTTSGGPPLNSDGGLCRHPGVTSEFGSCASSVDCNCPLNCANGTCLRGCASDGDCLEFGEICDRPSQTCQLPIVCSRGGGYGFGQACFTTTDCACPLSCDPDLLQCDFPCRTNSDCNGDGGQIYACAPLDGFDGGQCRSLSGCDGNLPVVSGEQGRCQSSADCACPLTCHQNDALGEGACQRSCQGDLDCGSADETCDRDGGVCQLSSYCGLYQLLPALSPCVGDGDCSCPLRCVFDAAAAGKLCELFDGGAYQGLGGSCLAMSTLPAGTAQTVGTACFSNGDCLCPARCAVDPVLGILDCQTLASCDADRDCPDPLTSCQGGVCQANLCCSFNRYSGNTGQEPANCLSAGAACPIPDAGLGTCEWHNLPTVSDQISPILTNGVLSSAGYCRLNGTATSQCNPGATRNRSDQLCPAGEWCAPLSLDAGVCAPVVDLFGSCPGSENPVPLWAGAVCLNSNACSPLLDAPGLSQSCPASPDACACPLTCSGGICLGPSCGQDSDCPASLPFCNFGNCSTKAPCLFSSTNTINPGDACSAGGLPGTCNLDSAPPVASTATYPATAPEFFCLPNGTAAADCDPGNAATARRCQAGDGCRLAADGGFRCQRLCSPEIEGSCASGAACSTEQPFAALSVAGPPNPVGEGVCLTLSDAGCAAGHAANQWSYCRSEVDCACSLDCVDEPHLLQTYGIPLIDAYYQGAASFCESPCQTSLDCLLPFEACSGPAGARHCAIDFCSADLNGLEVGGELGKTCNSDGLADGTCLPPNPLAFDAGFIPPGATLDVAGAFSAGLCYQGGTATGSCDPLADRGHPDQLCQAGSYCAAGPNGFACTAPCRLDWPSAQPPSRPCLSAQTCLAADFTGNLQGVILYTNYSTQNPPLTYQSGEIGLCLPALGVGGGAL